MTALKTLRAGQSRLTYKQIGGVIGCSEKSARRWMKLLLGEEGGSEPLPLYREALVNLSGALLAGRVEIVEKSGEDGRMEKIAVVHRSAPPPKAAAVAAPA